MKRKQVKTEMMGFRVSPDMKQEILKATEIAASLPSSTADITEILRAPAFLFAEHIIKMSDGKMDETEAAQAYLALLSEYTAFRKADDEKVS